MTYVVPSILYFMNKNNQFIRYNLCMLSDFTNIMKVIKNLRIKNIHGELLTH